LKLQLTSANAQIKNYQQDIKIAEAYLGRNWNKFMEDIEEDAGDALYKEKQYEFNMAGYTNMEKYELIKAGVDDVNQIRNYGQLKVDLETGKEISDFETVKREIDQRKKKEKEEFESGSKKNFDEFGTTNKTFV
jgi:hypothetical protein